MPTDSAASFVPGQRFSAVDLQQLVDDWHSGTQAAVLQSLGRIGCHAADRDDFAQETIIRLMDRQLDYSCADDLTRYAVRIARNLYISHLRRADPSPTAEATTREAATHDVAIQVEQRMALAAIGQAWQRLSEADRRLLDPDPDAESGGRDRKVAVRINVQRHRVRLKLKRATGGLLVAAIAVAGAAGAPHTVSHARHQLVLRGFRSLPRKAA